MVGNLEDRLVMAPIFDIRRRLLPENSYRNYLYTLFVQPSVREIINITKLFIRGHEAHANTDRAIQVVSFAEPQFSVHEVKKILIIKLDHIGDFVLGFPAYANLKSAFPEAEVTLLCGSWNKQLAEASGLFQRVVCYNLFPENSGDCIKGICFDKDAFNSLNLHNFDVAIDFRDCNETRFLLDVVNAKFRAGFYADGELDHMDLAFPSASFHLHGDKQTHHQTLQTLLAAAVITAFSEKPLMNTVLQDIAEKEQPVDIVRFGSGPIIGLNIGSGMREKNWPVDRFILLGSRLIKEQDATLVLLGAKFQEAEANVLAQALPTNKVINLTGEISLLQCVSTMQRLDAYIGNDTGTTHVAAGLNLPTICLFAGVTTHESHGAIGKSCISILANKTYGITMITVEDVMDALRRINVIPKSEKLLAGEGNLIIVDEKSYNSDFRKYLLRAANCAKMNTVHLCCWADITVTLNGQLFEKYSGSTSDMMIADDLLRILGQKKTIMLVGLTLDYRRIPLIQHLKMSFKGAVVLYDAFDYYRYDTKGLPYILRRRLDIIWQQECSSTLILEKGLKSIYSRARHFDNASHLRRLPSIVNVRSNRVVYIGSIDQRVDFAWLNILASHDVELHIYGRLHKDDSQVANCLESFINQRKNVVFHGGYDNDDLPAILAQYKIGIVPYKTHFNMTDHINPDKIYHYLNAGLEVLATPIPQAKQMASYLHLVYCEQDIATALEAAQTMPRNPSWPVEEYTWEKRWEELWQIAKDSGL